MTVKRRNEQRKDCGYSDHEDGDCSSEGLGHSHLQLIHGQVLLFSFFFSLYLYHHLISIDSISLWPHHHDPNLKMQRLTDLIHTIFQTTPTPSLLVTPPDEDQCDCTNEAIDESTSRHGLQTPQPAYDCHYLHPPDSPWVLRTNHRSSEELPLSERDQKRNKTEHCGLGAAVAKKERKKTQGWEWGRLYPVMALICYPSKRK